MKLLSAALLLCLASAATAQAKVFTITLIGDEESPPVATNGTGQAKVSVDPSGAVTVNGTYSNLTSDAFAAHIHGSARRGMNTGILVGLSQTGGTSGTISGGGMLNPGQVNDLLNGLTYVNLHTTMNSGGELRGQIDSVPGSGHPGAPSVTVTESTIPTTAASVPTSAGSIAKLASRPRHQ